MNAADQAESSINRSIDDLLLDSRNPRFVLGDAIEQPTQEQLALHMAEHYDALQIAESIAINGYFPSEPLIAVAEGSGLVVVEGNRRLAALKILNDARLRDEASALNPKWRRVAVQEPITLVPTVVVESREAVAPLLGFRHVTGLKKWESAAQAKFIAAQIDDQGRDFEEVASEIGLEPADVRRLYRDTAILEQAESEFGLDVSGARQAFGVWTNAIGRRGIRTYIGAPQPRSVTVEEWPVPDGNRDRLAEVLSLIFGGLGDDDSVIADSRELGDLARILEKGSPETINGLIESRDLASAREELELDSMSLERATAKLERSLSTYRSHHGALLAEHVLRAVDELVRALGASGGDPDVSSPHESSEA